MIRALCVVRVGDSSRRCGGDCKKSRMASLNVIILLLLLQELQSTTTQGWEIPGMRNPGIKHFQERMATTNGFVRSDSDPSIYTGENLTYKVIPQYLAVCVGWVVLEWGGGGGGGGGNVCLSVFAYMCVCSHVCAHARVNDSVFRMLVCVCVLVIEEILNFILAIFLSASMLKVAHNYVVQRVMKRIVKRYIFDTQRETDTQEGKPFFVCLVHRDADDESRRETEKKKDREREGREVGRLLVACLLNVPATC